MNYRLLVIQNISYSFVDDNPSFLQQELVKDAIAEYTKYANLNVDLVSDKKTKKSAHIRISFKAANGAWSAIGTDALKIREGPTMNLGFLAGSSDPGDNRDKFYNLTLHEFGHAFGLAHEWSRTWNTAWGKLDEEEEESDAIKQHKTSFQPHDTSNFSQPEQHSIMRCVQCCLILGLFFLHHDQVLPLQGIGRRPPPYRRSLCQRQSLAHSYLSRKGRWSR